jgi:hypothetical protein
MPPHPSPPPGPGRLTVHRTTAEPAPRTSQTFTQPPALESGPTANNRRGISEWARTVKRPNDSEDCRRRFNTPAGFEKYMRDLAEAAQSGPLTPNVIARVAT